MCGGAGTRLWPASREGRPKQFLRLFGRNSTFQETVHRVCDQSLFGSPIIITNGQYRFLVAEQLAEIGVVADILLEPIRRDSAPAIAAGASYAKRRGGNPVILALAADHVVADVEFVSCVVPQRPRCRRTWSHRDLRGEAGSSGDRVRLHLSGPGAGRRGLHGQEFLRKARRADSRALYQRGLPLELRQFHVRCGHDAR